MKKAKKPKFDKKQGGGVGSLNPKTESVKKHDVKIRISKNDNFFKKRKFTKKSEKTKSEKKSEKKFRVVKIRA